MKTKCKKCGKIFEMGFNGTIHGCDNCTGVQRDVNGYAWKPNEEEITFEVVATGKKFTVSREEAFRK